MRLVMDLQACQTSGSRFRGIGRYSMALAKAMLRRAGDHDVWVMLNGAFSESVDAVRQDLAGLLPENRVGVFGALHAVSAGEASHAWQRKAAEVLREAVLQDRQPSIVHVSSLFEGLGDDAVTSIGNSALSPSAAVTLYDLIPLVNQDVYLTNPVVRDWYFEKVESLRRAELLLAISESSRREAIEHLAIPAARVVNISSAADPMFRRTDIAPEAEVAVLAKFGLTGPFVMYTGGIDHRKNIEGLIRAFALLPNDVRRAHQLAIVCKVQDAERARLLRLASKQGLGSDELVLTGFVTDDELVMLCNLCRLFVFPSWHEGFGLPALEAMACGAPVIAANTSSLPEVVGRSDALFDPHRDEDITAAMQRVLVDEGFRRELSGHGLERSRLFSWDETARRALEAMEEAVASRPVETAKSIVVNATKPRLAVVSPFPPARSGIANYTAELLPALAEYYSIDLISDQESINETLPSGKFQRRNVAWFRANASNYDRVVYHFGNSSFHGYMFELLREVPGVVVLHDFYLGNLHRYLEFGGVVSAIWWQSLYESHGYPALIERKLATDSDVVVASYPCNWRVLADADGVIVHSFYNRNLTEQWYGSEFSQRMRVLPLHRQCALDVQGRDEACARLGLPASAFIVTTFGILHPVKLIHRLLMAWKQSGLVNAPDCLLVLTGDADDAAYVAQLQTILPLASAFGEGMVVMTGFLSHEQYQDLLQATDLAVQLRTDTRGETSGAILDCLAHGIPTIANAHGPVVELPPDALWLLSDEFDDQELVNALHTLRDDASRRRETGEAGYRYVKDTLAPARIACMHRDVIESLVSTSPRRRLDQLVHEVTAATKGCSTSNVQLVDAARAIAKIRPLGGLQQQLLVDISMLSRTDRNSGIQCVAVVRSVLAELLVTSPRGMRVEPVYFDTTGVCRYARRLTAGLLGLSVVPGIDAEIEVSVGDIFLGLDQYSHIVPTQLDYLRALRERGVSVQFVIYDLLPVLHPEWFSDQLAVNQQNWCRSIAEIADRVIAVSKSVADEYRDWLDGAKPATVRPLQIGHFHLGANIESSASSRGIKRSTRSRINALASRPVFLMVGAIEFHKGYAQALDAFELLWSQGSDVVLAIVSKRGGRVDTLLANRLRAHPERDRRLYWFEGVSDEALGEIYGRSTTLLAASLGEGFSLSLIEAARRGLSLLARDIPVFKEVAGDGAIYFRGDLAADLAVPVAQALEAWRKREFPDSVQIKALTWKESAIELCEALGGGYDVHLWRPGKRIYLAAGHATLQAMAKSISAGRLTTTGQAGYLVQGPALRLAAGHYMVRIYGEATVHSQAYVEAFGGDGRAPCLRLMLRDTLSNSGVICEYPLELHSDVDDLIVRVWVDERACLSFDALEICELESTVSQLQEEGAST